jgi:hypothetical protein
MDREILEVSEYTGEGYKPLIDCNGWRVAYLRYLDELFPAKIEKLERHLETDEVFVLLAGEVLLLMGGNGPSVTALETIQMQPLKLYNVRQAAWHGVVLSRDATILLVENTNTSPANSEYFTLTPELHSTLTRAARRLGDWSDLKDSALS